MKAIKKYTINSLCFQVINKNLKMEAKQMRKLFNFKESKLAKTMGAVTTGMILTASKVNAADVVTEVQGGGEIQSSKLGQGLLNMVKDVTGTMQWILPVVRSMLHVVLYF